MKNSKQQTANSILALTLLFLCISFNLKAQFITNGNNVSLPPSMNLGLGTQSFGWRLQVSPQAPIPNWGGILIQDNIPNATALKLATYGQTNGSCIISAVKNDDTHKGATLTINAEGGAVGIGTGVGVEYSNADYRLYVLKGIRTEKVRVDYASNWADYVFAPNYKLRPLSEVEAFIQKNQHLPDVPSAKEIHEKGIDLGEMHKIQMQKIEELTLYLLEMKKENDSLKKRLEALESNSKK